MVGLSWYMLPLFQLSRKQLISLVSETSVDLAGDHCTNLILILLVPFFYFIQLLFIFSFYFHFLFVFVYTESLAYFVPS